MNKVPYTLSENSLTIFWEGKPYTLRNDHPNFNLAKKAIFDARYDDLGDLLDITKSIENFGDVTFVADVAFLDPAAAHQGARDGKHVLPGLTGGDDDIG